MADPTLRILDLIDDPERYVREESVPVFVPHVRRDEEGEVEASVTQDDLTEIAANANAKATRYGVLVRVTRGHVNLHKPDEPPPPEDSQPPILGWAKDFRVGRWGPDEENVGLLADLYFDRRRYAEAMSYPFRSAEYYPQTGEITGVALLRRDPELDLGLLTYARRGQPERGQREASMPRPDDDLDELLGAGGHEDDAEQYADDHDEEDDDAEQYGDDHDEGEPDGDDYSPEEAEQYARMCRYMHQHASDVLGAMDDDDEDRPGVEQLARAYGRLAYAGEPAGGSTYVPGADDEEPPLPPIGDEDEDARGESHYARQGRQQQYARQERQVQQLRQEVALLHYEKQLLRLEQAGVTFDMEEELQSARDMSDKQRQGQLRRMARHYARSPVGGGMVPVLAGDAEADRASRPMTARQKQAALAYQQRQGCSWDQAMAWAKQNA